jgi:Kef-type K+ transport system membrane component KefB
MEAVDGVHAEARQLFTREERREVSWLAIVGTGIPFVLGLAFGPWLIGPALAGPNGNRISLIIILAVGVAVTSVPVVSKIFADLKILHTRFARLVLGVAVLEDIVLWLALAVATALAGQHALNPRQLSYHLITTVVFFGLALTIVPRAIKRINKLRFNVFAKHSPVAYALAVLMGYCVVAGALGVSLVFAAFLAGFAVVHTKRRLFAEALDAIGKVSFAFFVPLYFSIVGLKLDLVRGFSLGMVLVFIAGSCVVKILSVSLAGANTFEVGNIVSQYAVSTSGAISNAVPEPSTLLLLGLGGLLGLLRMSRGKKSITGNPRV